MHKNVAQAYPAVPMRMAGTTLSLQPFAAHIPAAVVGPARFPQAKWMNTKLTQ